MCRTNIRLNRMRNQITSAISALVMLAFVGCAPSASPTSEERIANPIGSAGGVGQSTGGADNTRVRNDPGVVASDAPAAKKREQYATPQACFAAMNDARDKKDFARDLSCVTTAVQNQQIDRLAFQLQQEAASNRRIWGQIAELYERHNLKGIDAMELMQIHDMPAGQGCRLCFGSCWQSRDGQGRVHDGGRCNLFFQNRKLTEPFEKPVLVEVKIEGDVHIRQTQEQRRFGCADPVLKNRRGGGNGGTAGTRKNFAGGSAESKAGSLGSCRLDSPKQEQRRRVSLRGCEWLGGAGLAAIPALTDLLERQRCRSRSCSPALSQILFVGAHEPRGEEGRPGVDRVAQRRRNGPSKCAASALGTLVPMRKAAIPALIELLKHKDAETRTSAAGRSGMGPEAKTAIPNSTQLLKDKDEEVRRIAAERWKHGEQAKTAIPALTELLRNHSDYVRQFANRGLAGTSVGRRFPLSSNCSRTKMQEFARRLPALSGTDVKEAVPGLLNCCGTKMQMFAGPLHGHWEASAQQLFQRPLTCLRTMTARFAVLPPLPWHRSLVSDQIHGRATRRRGRSLPSPSYSGTKIQRFARMRPTPLGVLVPRRRVLSRT